MGYCPSAGGERASAWSSQGLAREGHPRAVRRRPTCGVIRSSDVDYRATIDDPRIDDVRILRPQEIPLYVADGLFDIGITGRDWIEERGSAVTSLGTLPYSKATANPVRVVLAVPTELPVDSVDDLSRSATGANGALRVSTEYPELTRRYLADHGVRASVSVSYGATEAKVPDIADCVVEITETGRALRAAGLKIVETLLVSHTELIANPAAAADPAKRHAMEQLLTLLLGSLEARGKVLVKLNVPAEQLPEGHRKVLPSLRSRFDGSPSCSVEADSRWRRWCPSRRSTC